MEIFDFEVASLSSSSSTALLVPKFVLFFSRALLAAQIPSEAISFRKICAMEEERGTTSVRNLIAVLGFHSQIA